MTTAKEASVVLVGCGCPLRSMGWYHATAILDERVASCALKSVVEPFYMTDLGRQLDEAGYNRFHEWRKQVEQDHGVKFYASTSDVPPRDENEHRLGIISARTSDNPKLFAGCVDMGCQTVFLEKPGAPTVAELEKMRNDATEAGTSVFMGFNKNVSAYLSRTREFAAAQADRCDVICTFLHNNAYENTEKELAECFERNSEGMLKNMAIHELAILVTFYNVRVDTIASVEADKIFSSCKTLKGPSSGKHFTDFDKIKFKITTKAGVEINVAADRCGGDDSVGIVEASGKELARFTMPDEDAVTNIPCLEKEYPGAMPYFYAQDPDYLTLKQRVAKYCVDGTKPEGVATIDIAIDTLKVAEYLTPILQEQLKEETEQTGAKEAS